MQAPIMEASVSNELLEDEVLLWSGRPDPGRRGLVSPARVFLILGLVFLPVGLLLVTIGLVLLLAVVFPPGGQAGTLGLFIPGGVFVILGLIYLLIGLIGFFPTRNALYGITNRRVIIIRSGRYSTVSSYDRRGITQVHRLGRPDGSGDLLFSGTLSYGNTGNYQANTNGLSTNRMGIFSAIPNVRLAEQTLIRMLNEE